MQYRFIDFLENKYVFKGILQSFSLFKGHTIGNQTVRGVATIHYTKIFKYSIKRRTILLSSNIMWR